MNGARKGPEEERRRKERRERRGKEAQNHLASPGTVALCKIRQFQKSSGFLICKLPFVHWVQEITQQQKGNLHFQAMALLILQEAVETYAVNLFEDVNLCGIRAERVAVMPKDIQLADNI